MGLRETIWTDVDICHYYYLINVFKYVTSIRWVYKKTMTWWPMWLSCIIYTLKHCSVQLYSSVTVYHLSIANHLLSTRLPTNPLLAYHFQCPLVYCICSICLLCPHHVTYGKPWQQQPKNLNKYTVLTLTCSIKIEFWVYLSVIWVKFVTWS